MKIPRATYRIQFNPDFNFDDAARLADYLADLGISHLYASPYLQPVKGSTHGYDVIDHHRVNEELGGEKGHKWLCRRLRECKLGQILDIVPNHMAISDQNNKWWWDVLENGPSSSYSSYFDVDWEYPHDTQRNKILLPILGDHYGRILEAKEIKLERNKGTFIIRYYDHFFPVAPRSLVELLSLIAESEDSRELGFIASALEYLPLPSSTDRENTKRRKRDKEVLQKQLSLLLVESPHISRILDEEIDKINQDPERMDILLENQNYRLAYWRLSRSDLSYRRFFNINDLIALRIEEQYVFDDTHLLIKHWMENCTIDGVRIDHPDGLWDPVSYFTNLRQISDDAWIVAEKILEPDETLPTEWNVAGTTGYDFLFLVDNLFVDQAHKEAFTTFYRNLTGETRDYETMLYERKRQVVKELLDSDVNRLTQVMHKICENNRMYRDFTLDEQKETLIEYIINLPVYRTYIQADVDMINDADKKIIKETIKRAKMKRPDIDAQLFDFLYGILTLQADTEAEKNLAMRIQQLTGPVMAKGAEDTTFYWYNRFTMLNEVGGNPDYFGISTDMFHERAAKLQAQFPYTMVTTSTHDTKRSEDVRMRLAVISEIPDEWERFIFTVAENNRRYKQDDFPDVNTEYLIYQTMVGAWPINAERLLRYIEKAMREAKVYTSWQNQNHEYEQCVFKFITGIYDDEAFIKEVKVFTEKIKYTGFINSLSQTLVKLTAYGVPDIYQGCELWNFSLVDPDNRQPVDFTLRQKLLSKIEDFTSVEILDRMDEGIPKLYLLAKTLNVRKKNPGFFSKDAAYTPCSITGAKTGHVLAYYRGKNIVTVVPRFTKKLNGTWDDTTLHLEGTGWTHCFTNQAIEGDSISIADLFRDFPVALLIRK